MSDPADVGACRGGTVDLATLYLEHSSRLTYFALRRLGDAAAAEDAVHEVFASTLHAIRVHSNTRVSRSYLYVALRRECQRALERRSILLPSEPTAFEAFFASRSRTTGDDVEDELYAREWHEWLDRALAALSPQREAVMRRWLQDSSYAQIAGELGISVNTVNAHVQAGKKLLRQRRHESMEQERERERERDSSPEMRHSADCR